MPGSPGGELIARELRGDLLCARCRYNLRGLSVRATCPECGTPVKGTLLAVIDPRARELQPIEWPRLRAVGLMVWGAAGLGAALLIWLLRLEEISANLNVEIPTEWARRWVTVLVAVSGAGALTMIRPHRGIPAWQVAGAAVGAAMYVPLVYVTWLIHGVIDAAHAGGYFAMGGPDPRRTVLRLVTAGLLAVVILGLRGNARLYVGRSLLMRTGRVDRQTLLGLLAALAMGVIGDLIHLLGRDSWGGETTAVTVGTFLIGVSGVLFTLGLVGVAIDCYRLMPVVLSPPLSASDVLGDDSDEMEAPGRAGDA
ncbi:MAG: hypothetical protein IT436_06975 [Phycisphaerales bacterium]|nr:hypothetical protein [Phycisphaerales bacterium]